MLPIDFFKITEDASNYGITSTKQLAVFIILANEMGSSLPDVADKYKFDNYKSFYATCRKLMEGDLTRKDGLKLLKWAKEREKRISLTSRGIELKALLDVYIKC